MHPALTKHIFQCEVELLHKVVGVACQVGHILPAKSSSVLGILFPFLLVVGNHKWEGCKPSFEVLALGFEHLRCLGSLHHQGTQGIGSLALVTD